MLLDKDMANDALEMKKVFAGELTKAAAECSNTQLRQTFLQIREQTEREQERLGQLAVQQGWYLPAAEADQQNISRVKSFIEEGQSAAAQQQPTTGMQTGTRVFQ